MNLRDILRDLARAGWHIERTRKNHIKAVSPGGAIVICSGTPSDHRAVKNFVAQTRKAG